MAGFTDHLERAKLNLQFLESLSSSHSELWDWKITVAYYAGLHLISAFVADKCDLHPDSHEKLKEITHPQSKFKDIQLDEKTFTSYSYLEMLSRRARYLCDVNTTDKAISHHCSGKHFTNAIKQLDVILRKFNSIYNSVFDKITVSSTSIEKTDKLTYFAFKYSIIPSQETTLTEEKILTIEKEAPGATTIDK